MVDADCNLICEIIKKYPDANFWLLTIFPLALALFRSIAEILSAIAARTESKTDDAIVQKLNKIIWALAKISAWFGAGVPQKIVNKKISEQK